MDGRALLTKRRIATRTRERHAAVHALLEQGQGLREMARLLPLGRNTVRRLARATSHEDLLVHNDTGRRPTNLDAYGSRCSAPSGDLASNFAGAPQRLADDSGSASLWARDMDEPTAFQPADQRATRILSRRLEGLGRCLRATSSITGYSANAATSIAVGDT